MIALFLAALRPSHARAEGTPEDHARSEYDRGNTLAHDSKWAEALGAFEASYAAKPHALTLYNIGVCERVLGRATRAREKLRLALTRAESDPRELPESIREETRGFLDEYTRLLPRIAVTLDPKDAGIAVDGRPLRVVRGGARPVLEAGVEAPGIGRPPPNATFDLEVDPGTHVLTLTRQGYRDVVHTRVFSPGQRGALELSLTRLPAVIHVSSTLPGAQVRVNGLDVGLTPVDVVRPAGVYRLVVSHPGYVTFTNDVTLAPGDESNLRAALPVERVPLTKRWWFWAGAATVVAAGAFVTYLATRPTPEPVPYDGGTSGWVVFP